MIDEVFRTDGTLLERLVDNLDGTGTRTTYDTDGNITGTEELTGLPIPEPVPLTETEVLAKHVLAPKVRAEELSDAELAEVAPLFPAWDGNGVEYTAGDVVRHLGELYEVNQGQGHTSQPDWSPDVAVSLFKAHRPAGQVSAWVQPIPPDFYPLDAVVTHNGSTWKSLHAANVWEPGAVGTEALWEQVG